MQKMPLLLVMFGDDPIDAVVIPLKIGDEIINDTKNKNPS